MPSSTTLCQRAASSSLSLRCTRPQHQTLRWHAPIHRPLLAAAPQRRDFSCTNRGAYPGARVDPRAAGIKSAKQARPSMKVTMKQMQKTMGNTGSTDELIVKDFGLLPQSLIYPTGANLPSFTTGFSRRIKFITRWAKQKVGDIYGVYWNYKRNIATSKPWPKMQPKQIAPTAKEIHKRVYEAFARGDRRTLTKLCVESVLGQYMNRLARRPDNERMRWSVEEYLERPRLVSHRATQLPMLVEGQKAGVRQCVVRIRTLQKLQVGRVGGEAGAAAGKSFGRPRQASKTRDGKEAEESVEWRAPTTKEVTEYVVIQRWMVRGKEQPWVLWGFVDETTELEGEAAPGEDMELGMKPLE